VRSLLLPMSMIVMLGLACCRASSNQLARWLKVSRLRASTCWRLRWLRGGAVARRRLPQAARQTPGDRRHSGASSSAPSGFQTAGGRHGTGRAAAQAAPAHRVMSYTSSAPAAPR